MLNSKALENAGAREKADHHLGVYARFIATGMILEEGVPGIFHSGHGPRGDLNIIPTSPVELALGIYVTAPTGCNVTKSDFNIGCAVPRPAGLSIRHHDDGHVERMGRCQTCPLPAITLLRPGTYPPLFLGLLSRLQRYSKRGRAFRQVPSLVRILLPIRGGPPLLAKIFSISSRG